MTNPATSAFDPLQNPIRTTQKVYGSFTEVIYHIPPMYRIHSVKTAKVPNSSSWRATFFKKNGEEAFMRLIFEISESYSRAEGFFEKLEGDEGVRYTVKIMEEMD